MKAYFWVEKETPEPWWVMAYFGVKSNEDLDKLFGTVLAAGAGRDKASEAIEVLSNVNNGYIFTNYKQKATVICISHATSYDELFDTINHEIDHAKAHICEYFGIELNGEKSAYLQGEISKQMYKGVALTICPRCNCGRH